MADQMWGILGVMSAVYIHTAVWGDFSAFTTVTDASDDDCEPLKGYGIFKIFFSKVGNPAFWFLLKMSNMEK